MRVAVASFGSEGDIRPFVALTRRLREAGHDAFLLATPLFAPRAEEGGVPLRPVGPPVDTATLTARMREEMPPVAALRNPARQARRILAHIAGELRAGLPSVLAATREVDLVVHSVVDVAAYAAARVHARPRIPVHLFHGLLPARASLPDGASLGPPVNRLLTGAMRGLLSLLTDGLFRPLLADAGLPPQRHVLLDAAEAPPHTLLAVSPSLVPPDPLWEGRVVQTGYWFLDVPAFTPPPALASFLSAGAPPVVVTFGSMAGADAAGTTRVLAAAARRAGCRVVLQAGWGGLGEGALPANLHRAGYVPHDWLFPRAAGVIHHGGAGTTAAALRAGVPQAVVWQLADQPFWGRLLFRRGLAPVPPVHHRDLREDWLERTLRELHTRAGLRARAAAMGARIRAEDGTGRAVEAIARAVRTTRR